jgi:hypothetical protein
VVANNPTNINNMNENLLQYIWQFQLFNKMNLYTTELNNLIVLNPGNKNDNQGPDFLNGKIIIENTTWIGSIEIHVKTSDWKLHGHSNDNNYNNVILHVVWEHDVELNLSFPTLELKSLVPKLILQKYEMLLRSKQFIPCENNINTIKDLQLEKWKETLVFNRLKRKADLLRDELNQNNFDWIQVLWMMIARAFGGSVNGDAFFQLANSIPIKLLLRHQNDISTIEAILMGQAGLLDKEFEEDYPVQIRKEYLFLKHKYHLEKPSIRLLFLRMRPYNFPTVRLAQLSAFISNNANRLGEFLKLEKIKNYRSCFKIKTQSYWDDRFRFDEPSVFQKKKMSDKMISNLLINAIIPTQFAYGFIMNEEKYISRAMDMLSENKAEKNKIVENFIQLNVIPKNALDTQFLIELKNEYCNHKHCLNCQIGYAIFKS